MGFLGLSLRSIGCDITADRLGTNHSAFRDVRLRLKATSATEQVSLAFTHLSFLQRTNTSSSSSEQNNCAMANGLDNIMLSADIYPCERTIEGFILVFSCMPDLFQAACSRAKAETSGLCCLHAQTPCLVGDLATSIARPSARPPGLLNRETGPKSGAPLRFDLAADTMC